MQDKCQRRRPTCQAPGPLLAPMWRRRRKKAMLNTPRTRPGRVGMFRENLPLSSCGPRWCESDTKTCKRLSRQTSDQRSACMQASLNLDVQACPEHLQRWVVDRIQADHPGARKHLHHDRLTSCTAALRSWREASNRGREAALLALSSLLGCNYRELVACSVSTSQFGLCQESGTSGEKDQERSRHQRTHTEILAGAQSGRGSCCIPYWPRLRTRNLRTGL